MRARRGPFCLAPLAGALALAPSALPALAVEVPQRFAVQGSGTLTVSGPGCCGGTPFPGVFEVHYEADAAGHVAFTSLELELVDLDLTGVGFGGLGHVALRCAFGSSRGPFAGSLAAGGVLRVPARGVTVEGGNFKARDAAGRCTEPDFGVAAENPEPLLGLHDPTGDRFTLGGTFETTLEGGRYTLTVALEGRFLNRPPLARLGLVLPDFPQGGCPAVPVPGNPPRRLLEANHPSGLKAPLRAFSHDPDGALGRSDLASELWYHQRGGGAAEYLGAGAELEARLFEYGPLHRLELLATDRLGASDSDECAFEVVDRTAPVVVAPAPRAVRCTLPGGATPETSPELAAFLAGAAARDAGDGGPEVLPPRVAGAAVGSGTLFPLDAASGGPSEVEFRFRDASGNLGSALAAVSVYDDAPPSLAVTLEPEAGSPKGGAFVPVAASLAVADACSPVSVWLESIASNAPGLDPEDVLDAAFGTDDRSFSLRARPAGPGAARIYEVTYRAMDLYGYGASATATFTVPAE